MAGFTHCLLFSAVFICVASHDDPNVDPKIPLIPTGPGYHLSVDPETFHAPIRIEAFLDINCPDSKAAWPILHTVQEHYGPNCLDILLYLNPLPYHLNAYLGAQGFFLVADKAPGSQFAFMDQVYSHIEDYNLIPELIYNRTYNEMVRMYAEDAYIVAGIDQDEFVRDIDNYYQQTRTTWKAGARRMAAGTPWYFINSVDLSQVEYPLTLEMWIEILDPLYVGLSCNTGSVVMTSLPAVVLPLLMLVLNMFHYTN